MERPRTMPMIHSAAKMAPRKYITGTIVPDTMTKTWSSVPPTRAAVSSGRVRPGKINAAAPPGRARGQVVNLNGHRDGQANDHGLHDQDRHAQPLDDGPAAGGPRHR